MKIATVRYGSHALFALVQDGYVFDAPLLVASCCSGEEAQLLPATVLEALARPEALALCRRALEKVAGVREEELPREALLGRVGEVSFLPPVYLPGKILCLAGNYAEHIEEGGREKAPLKETTNPWIFTKPATTGLIGDGAPIQIPKVWKKVDWEAELAVIVGRRGKYIEAERALDYVAGYAVFNDVSGRGLNLAPHRVERPRDAFFDWFHGKQMDTFAVLGPWLVTPDEVGDPQTLRITLRVNGKVKQDASTAKMIFSVAEIIAFASQIMTLEPGDVIATGTPAGVGAAQHEFLRPGDVVEVEVEKVGTLRNPVIDEMV